MASTTWEVENRIRRADKVAQLVSEGKLTHDQLKLVERKLESHDREIKHEIIIASNEKYERKRQTEAEIAACLKRIKERESAPPSVVKGQVWMSNELNAAQHGLSFNEKRLIHLAASKLIPNLDPQPPVTITLDDWLNVFGGTRNAAREALKNGSEHLSVRRYVRMMPDKASGEIVPTPFEWVRVKEDDRTFMNGQVEINFHENVLLELVNLHAQDKFFMKIGLREISGLRSKHSIRLLELICGWRSTGKLAITVEDLRRRMEIPECYHTFSLMKAKILAPAILEISEWLQINIKLTEKRIGRDVKSVVITFKIFKIQESVSA